MILKNHKIYLIMYFFVKKVANILLLNLNFIIYFKKIQNIKINISI